MHIYHDTPIPSDCLDIPNTFEIHIIHILRYYGITDTNQVIQWIKYIGLSFVILICSILFNSRNLTSNCITLFSHMTKSHLRPLLKMNDLPHTHLSVHSIAVFNQHTLLSSHYHDWRVLHGVQISSTLHHMCLHLNILIGLSWDLSLMIQS